MKQSLMLEELNNKINKLTEDHEKLLKLLQDSDIISLQNKKKENYDQLNNVYKDKYKIAIKLVNKILSNIGKKKINSLTDFKDIKREDIITESNKKTLEEEADELFKYFDKSAFGWYRRKTTKNYILTFLRKMCNDLGLSLKYEEKHFRTETVWMNSVRYSIVNV